MADIEGASVHSEEQEIDEEEWDVIHAENELEQLTVHFEEGGVGASLYIDASASTDGSDTNGKDKIAALQDRNAALEARVAELEHELAYADKARANSEQRNAQLCAANATLAEQAHLLTEKVTQMKKDLDGALTEKKSLEKNTVQLESFVEETISNSQSGYNYLCEARESVSDITKDLMGLRCFLTGEIGGLAVADGMGFKGGVLQSVMADFNVTLGVFKEVFAEVSAEVRRLKSTKHSWQMGAAVPPPAPNNKIALAGFTEGDVAMFFPTPKGDYVAFNIGTPHHYLSEESKALIGHDPHFKKVYVLGRIIMKEEKQAGGESPPFNLKAGTTYYEISVESIVDMFPAAAMKGSNHKFRDTAGTSSSHSAKNGHGRFQTREGK